VDYKILLAIKSTTTNHQWSAEGNLRNIDLDSISMNGRFIDVLERTWKEAVMAYSKCCPGNCLELLKESTKASHRMVSVPAETRTEQLQNRNLEGCRCANRLGHICHCTTRRKP
jgi:hypothetical protein